MNLALIVPSALGLFLLSRDIVDFFLYRGAFTQEALIKTSELLKLLAIALPFQSLGKIFATKINATGNTKNTMIVSIISLIINVITSISLMPLFGYLAVGYGTIISSIGYLSLFLFRNFNLSKKNYIELLKYLLSSFIMALYLIFLGGFLPLLLQVFSSIIIYFTILCIINADLAKKLLKKILYKGKKSCKIDIIE
jgi:peptidoglycan biosynthesis protein MviN/MurJ (putative lipid II flippase)